MHFPVDLPPHLLDLARALQLDPALVEEHFIRGGGHGGQKINKTASTVQLRHAPSGIEVRTQRFREQSKNRLEAWKMLILKLDEQVRGRESETQRTIFKIIKQKRKRGKRAQEKVLEQKRERALIKELRRKIL